MSITADQWVSNNINIVQGDQCQKHYTVHGRVVPENGTKHAEVFQASKSSLNLPSYLTKPSVVLLSLVSCGIRPAKRHNNCLFTTEARVSNYLVANGKR